MGSSVVELVSSDCKPVAPPTVQPIIGCIGPAAFSVSLALSRRRSCTSSDRRHLLTSFSPVALFPASSVSLDGIFDSEKFIPDFGRVQTSINEQAQHDVVCGIHYLCSPISKNVYFDVKRIFDRVGKSIAVFAVSSHPFDRIEELQNAIAQARVLNPEIDVWVSITPDIIGRYPNPRDLALWIQQTWCVGLGVSGFIFDLRANHMAISATIDVLNSCPSAPLFRFLLADGFTRDFDAYDVVRLLIARWQNIGFLQQSHLTTMVPHPVVDHLTVARFFSSVCRLLTSAVDDTGNVTYSASL